MRRLVVLAAITAASACASFARWPYLQNLTGSSVVVRWETDVPLPGLVQYGFTRDYGMEAVQAAPDSLHEVTLAGLASDTGYHYRVICGPDTSPDVRFNSSASPGRPFRFFVHGDTRTDSAAHQAVIDRMLLVQPEPGFSLHVGDLTEYGTVADYTTFFNIERRLLCRTPMFATVGNHDLVTPDNWYRFVVLPGNELWYTLRYGSAVFHTLSTYHPFLPGSEQYEWLLAQLQADSADPTIRHRFVWFHDPPYTTSMAHTGNLDVQAYLCPLFRNYGVEIVFLGHVHAYERSLVDGVHYVISGGGGAPLAYEWYAAEPWTVFRLTCYEFSLVDVRGDSTFCRSIMPDGTVIDSFITTHRVPGMQDTGQTPPRLDIKAVPSPFTGRVQFGFRVGRAGHVRLAVQNAAGRLVSELINHRLERGEYTAVWSSSAAGQGIYFITLSTPEGRSVVRVTHAR